MRLFFASLFLLVVALALHPTPAHATSHCEFVLGFKTLRDLIGHDIVGECLENARYTGNGNSEQRTTGGLLVLRKADNVTAFTDGYHTWLNGPNGLQKRLNYQRFAWESEAAPDPTPTVTADPTLTAAIQLMRTTLSGERAYQWYLAERIRVSFGVLESGIGTTLQGSTLVLTEDYRSAGHAFLAAELVEVAAWYQLGDPTTAVECLEDYVQTETASAQFWLEMFSRGGKQNPTAWESWLNDRLQAHLTGSLRNSVLSDASARDFCTQEYEGELPPLPTPTPIPTPTPRPIVDPARIDPGLAAAFQSMRNAPFEEIDELYDWFVASGARARFGPLGESSSRFDPPSLITINEEYRNESPEALAHTLIWPLASLHASERRDGSPQSYDGCIADFIAAHSAQALWWIGIYAAGGKQNPTRLEQGANYNLARYLDNSLGTWVRSSDNYRQYCSYYGEPPPLPTPTPIPALTLPWGMLEIDIANQLEKAGYDPRSASFTMFINHLSWEYGYLPHALFLAWLDAGGRGIEDATSELWSEFFRAFLFNPEFRRTSIVSVGQYLKANTHLGPVLTAFLKAEHIGTYEERVLFVASVQNAMLLSLPRWMADRIGGTRDCLSTPSCNRVWFELRGSLDGKDLSALPAVPSPWYKN